MEIIKKGYIANDINEMILNKITSIETYNPDTMELVYVSNFYIDCEYCNSKNEFNINQDGVCRKCGAYYFKEELNI